MDIPHMSAVEVTQATKALMDSSGSCIIHQRFIRWTDLWTVITASSFILARKRAVVFKVAKLPVS